MGRLALSKSTDWKLVNKDQDIRGWPVRNAAGQELGKVTELIANTESELVESIVLDNGREYPAQDIEIGDHLVYVESVSSVGTSTDPVVKKYHNPRVQRADWGDEVPAGFTEHESTFRRHYESSFATAGQPYDYFAPAYAWGYRYGTAPEYRNRNYRDLEAEMRSGYEEKHGVDTWERVKDAAEHAFQHGRR